MLTPQFSLGNIVTLTTGATFDGVVYGEPFTSITGELVDPDIVKLIFQRQAETEVEFTYGSSAIVRVSMGIYTFAWDSLASYGGPGKYRGWYVGRPNSGADTTQTGATSPIAEWIINPTPSI